VEIQYPSLLKRVYSFLIDTGLKVFLLFIATVTFSWMKLEGEKENWIKGIVFVLVIAVYEPLSMRLGATFGNYSTGIRVRRYLDPTKRINLFQAYCRYIVKILFGWLSCFTIGFNAQRRALHDMVGESIVIEKIK
jgi:uncharacterized RDD family membrane protein YckC